MKPATRQTLLWASLGLNVAFIAALLSIATFPEAGARLFATPAQADTTSRDGKPSRDRGDHGDRGRDNDPMQREFDRIAKAIDLAPSQRERIQKLMDEGKKEGRTSFSQMKDERLKSFKSILENPTDDAAFQQTIAESSAFHESMATTMLSRFRVMAQELTPEQRAKLLKEFEDWNKREDGPPKPPKD